MICPDLFYDDERVNLKGVRAEYLNKDDEEIIRFTFSNGFYKDTRAWRSSSFEKYD
ncbi:hypothetical protein [Campylobacter sp. CCS1377]|uniref:Uncharacterized protein n=1 Tax=Campylobacter sp. CCS1377 TaxID=3158229 RepID=A0AAU7E6S9_9BACT